jgi:glycerol-3-phosphate dehydrogenase
MAPHLVQGLPFYFPIYRGDPDPLWLVRSGVALYGRLSGASREDIDLRLGAHDLLEAMPLLRRDGLKGGARYLDARTDDARLTLSVLRDASARGAVLLNYAPARAFAREGDLHHLTCRDEESGETFVVRARRLLLAAGPWTDEVLGLLEDGRAPLVRRSAGTHLALRSGRLPLDAAWVMRGPDGRMMFAVPYGTESYIGTTDILTEELDGSTVPAAEAEYILAAADRTFPEARLGQHDVIGAWRGVRPLARPGRSRSASRVSREDRLVEVRDGMHVVVGGKLTAFRAMAERIVDRIYPGTQSAGSAAASRSPLPGAQGEAMSEDVWRQAARRAGVRMADLRERLGPYGDEAATVLQLGVGPGTLRFSLDRAILRFAVAEEFAMHLVDVYRRRTDRLLFGGDFALQHLKADADEMGRLLGWSEARREAEVAAVRRLEAEMLSWRAAHSDEILR